MKTCPQCGNAVWNYDNHRRAYGCDVREPSVSKEELEAAKAMTFMPPLPCRHPASNANCCSSCGVPFDAVMAEIYRSEGRVIEPPPGHVPAAASQIDFDLLTGMSLAELKALREKVNEAIYDKERE